MYNQGLFNGYTPTSTIIYSFWGDPESKSLLYFLLPGFITEKIRLNR